VARPGAPGYHHGEAEGTVYRSVLAVVDPGSENDLALEEALGRARASHARLTLLCAVPPPCGLVCFASVCRESLHAEALAVCERELRQLAARVPADLPVTTVIAPVASVRAVRREVARADHDLVVLGGRRARLTAWRLARRCPAAVVRAGLTERAPRPAGVGAPVPGAG
jgi:nucleotide-binding universal stress UspA family protein